MRRDCMAFSISIEMYIKETTGKKWHFSVKLIDVGAKTPQKLMQSH
jgi:hypothetical protein